MILYILTIMGDINCDIQLQEFVKNGEEQEHETSLTAETCEKTDLNEDKTESKNPVYNPDEFYDNSAIADQFQSNIETNELLKCENDSSTSSDSFSKKYSNLETAYNTPLNDLMDKLATRSSCITSRVCGIDTNIPVPVDSGIYDVNSRYSNEYTENKCIPKNILTKGSELLACPKPLPKQVETSETSNTNENTVETNVETEKLSSHYHQGNIEPIDLIDSMDLNFNLGNVIKYISRCNYKGQKKEDLLKAKWYLERELKKLD